MSKNGNTSSSTCAPALNWCFTLNNPSDGAAMVLCSTLKHYCSKWVFQEEEGESGTPHFQGYLRFKQKRRPLKLFEHIGGFHWEVTRSPAHAIAYCSDPLKRTGNVWSDGVPVEKKPLKLITRLMPHQQEILDLVLTEPDDRTITWVYNESGKTGKTQLCKLICAKYDGLLIGGSKADMTYAVANYIDEKNPPEIILVDMARCERDNIDYAGLEKIKDGIFASTKYKSKMVIFNSPHIVVFANDEPDWSKFTDDR